MGTLLEDGLKSVGIEDDKIPLISEKMEKYIEEIIICNAAFNLTNTSDHDELVVRHVLDSLAAYVPFRDFIATLPYGGGQVSIGDIGSGGGLPGIPLAVAFPNHSFTLVERMEKRCGFLEKCKSVLGLSNVTILKGQAEFVTPKSFDIVTFRAFRPLERKMAKKLLRLRKDGGILAAYKAKMENITAEMDAIKMLVPEYKVVELYVPGLENSERNLVII